MNIIAKIAESADQQRYQNNNYQEVTKPQENKNNSKPKHFLEETFTYNMSKQPPKKKTHSVLETKKQINEFVK